MKIITIQHNYKEYFQEIDEDKKNICLITGIKLVDRSSENIFNDMLKRYNPIMSFVIYDNENINPNNAENVQYYINDKRGNSVFVRILLNYLSESKNSINKCLIDASAINKETLLEIMYILEQFLSIEIGIIYLTPEDYGNYQYDSYKVPYSMSFSPGIQLMGKKNILVLLSGYEGLGEIALTRYIEPSVLYIGIAEPSSEEQFFRENKKNKEKVIAEFSKYEGIEIKDFIYSGNNITQCTEDILKLFKENKELSDCNLFIAPMNNKLTTLAVFNIWRDNQNIQIVDIRGTKKIGSKDESGVGSLYYSKYER